MWIVAGVLLGSVVVTSLVGFHSGPHTHIVAGVVGIVAAAWLLFMATQGRSAPLLWLLLSADVVISGGIGVMGWTAIRRPGGAAGRTEPRRLEGAEGVAVTDLSPEGIVRVGGEQWSATCVNGTLPAGSRVQVLHGGVRLEVWGEPLPEGPPELGGRRVATDMQNKERGT
jgi:membrane-bound ClpP family serine protease